MNSILSCLIQVLPREMFLVYEVLGRVVEKTSQRCVLYYHCIFTSIFITTIIFVLTTAWGEEVADIDN